jgi:membrane-bound metal-dependent hydrolase YbcI (DUF457 family)
MGSYRQHIGLASALGAFYAVGAWFWMGLHWLYAVMAGLIATLGGLLPDIDSPTGVQMRTLSGVLGILAAGAIWQHGILGSVEVPFELMVLGMLGAFFGVQRGLKMCAGRLMVHRGISHSVPALGVWCLAVFLIYPSEYVVIRLTMAVAVGVGVLSHLVLDECCSVDLANTRLNKAFGTALKFWANSVWSTAGIYVLLAYLLWRALGAWPSSTLGEVVRQEVPDPVIPYAEAKEALLGLVKSPPPILSLSQREQLEREGEILKKLADDMRTTIESGVGEATGRLNTLTGATGSGQGNGVGSEVARGETTVAAGGRAQSQRSAGSGDIARTARGSSPGTPAQRAPGLEKRLNAPAPKPSAAPTPPLEPRSGDRLQPLYRRRS